MDYYKLDIKETLSRLNSNEKGLTDKEVNDRLKIYGENKLSSSKSKSILDIFISQFRNSILILLIIASLVSFFLGSVVDAIAIALAVILNIVFGTFLEYSADKSVEKLKNMIKLSVVVLRNGLKKQIDSKYLVPGDIIFLSEGQKVPADCRILYEKNLEVNESVLTGESYPVKKCSDKLSDTDLIHRYNMLYAGTYIIKGECKAIVVRTGVNTEFGKISENLKTIEKEESPLQIKLKYIGKVLTIFSIFLTFLIFLFGFLTNKPLYDLFIYSISLIVAIVPEGMLTTLTIILTIGIFNMAKENVIVRKMFSVETLGNINFVASDKTGTITEGKMALKKIYFNNKLIDLKDIKGNEKILEYAYLCNSAHIVDSKVVGDEIDASILKLAQDKQYNLNNLFNSVNKISFYPFDYDKKMMYGEFKINGNNITIYKGALENILSNCKYIEINQRILPLTENIKKDILDVQKSLCFQGMRLIALSYKINNKIVFLGILSFFDKIRKNIKETIDLFKKAGIKILILTGDNKETAYTIGKEINLVSSIDQVKKWDEISDISEVEKLKIIARAAPFSKLKVINYLMDKYIVGVTGDGVNDAMCLKKAHLGIAMGSGADVTKEVADIVLLDDNFSTLIKAVVYGRSIMNNILNFLKYELAANISLVLLTIPSLITNLILNPIQILWVNLIIDGPPALTLAFEKPKGLKQYKMNNKFWTSLFLSSVFMFSLTYLTYLYFNKYAPKYKETAAFTLFIFMQAFNLFNNRDIYKSFYVNLNNNKYIFVSFIFVVLSQIFLLYTNINTFFRIYPLPYVYLIALFLLSSLVLLFEELRKRFIRE